MKSTRYSSYQPLLKVLAQAAIADRPEGWSEGELCLVQDGPALVCRLRRADVEPEQPAPVRVQAAAQALVQALAQDGLPWVGCRIGFFRKSVGWGVRVRITPSHGSPELDLTPDRAAPLTTPKPTLSAAGEVTEALDRSVLPGLDDPFSLQPQARVSLSVAPPARSQSEAMPLSTRPAPADPALLAGRRHCPHCRVDSLRFMLRDAGTDHYQCERCGYKLAMVAPEFGDVAYLVKPHPDERDGPHPAQPELQADGRITGPDYSMHLSSPETLMYQSGNMQVPVRVVQDVARGLRVLEAERLSTVDTPFGARMLTPREHESILQHLRQAVHLLPGRYLVE